MSSFCTIAAGRSPLGLVFASASMLRQRRGTRQCSSARRTSAMDLRNRAPGNRSGAGQGAVVPSGIGFTPVVDESRALPCVSHQVYNLRCRHVGVPLVC